MSTVSFMAEFDSLTIANPFSRHERVWELRAAFEVKPFDGAIMLGCVRSFERGQGNGSAALTWLCRLADKHNVILRGSIKPVGLQKPRLTTPKLRAWYKRHGFKVSRNVNIERVNQ